MNTDAPTQSVAQPRQWNRFVFGRKPVWTLVRLVVLILTVFILLKFVLYPIRVTGVSMSPTYKDGSLNVINRLAYQHEKPKRGDVILIKGMNGKEHLLKRIIGMPGERVSIWDGVVRINRQPLDEPYVKLKAPWIVPPIVLYDNEYYVIGDNREMPPRQHMFGVIKDYQIEGKIAF